ncbi:MAG TPA: 6-phosphofructokinase [Verrucomicrobiae bacterium]|nr:6-phosphofructokinase [Verrucomicrobiae bacterium]
MKKIAMLTGGGDCPGLNAVIRAVTRKALGEGYEVFGFRNGWAGVLKGDYFPLTRERVSGILHLGGTILGTSRTNPTDEQLETIIKHIKSMDLFALVAVGGDDTLSVASRLHKRGVPVIGVPKTIDNDIDGTDQTFGFDTAINIAAEALDRLHTTAEAHSRVLVVELMGRQAGWIALEAGIAGGADLVLLPEFPISLAEICKILKQRQAGGKNFSIVAVAEGFKLEGAEVLQTKELDAFGHVRLGGIGETLCKEIEKITGIESRAVVLGHIQRGGTPSAYDRVLGTRYGVKAVDLAMNGEFGRMVALRGPDVVGIPFDSVITEGVDKKTGRPKLRMKNRFVSKELYEVAKVFFG